MGLDEKTDVLKHVGGTCWTVEAAKERHAICKVHIDNHIGHVVEQRGAHVGDYAYNGEVVLHHMDGLPDHIARFRKGLGQTFRNEGRRRLVDLVGISFRKLDWKHIEEVTVATHHMHQALLVATLHLRVIDPSKLGDGLYFGDAFPDGFLHAVFELQQVLESDAVNLLAVRVLARDGNMLAHIAEDDDHEGEADRQPHGLDDAVKFVPAEELQITTHNSITIKIGITIPYIVPKLYLNQNQQHTKSLLKKL